MSLQDSDSKLLGAAAFKSNMGIGVSFETPIAIELLEVPRDRRTCSVCSHDLRGKAVAAWPDVTPERAATKGVTLFHFVVCTTCVERMADAAGLL